MGTNENVEFNVTFCTSRSGFSNVMRKRGHVGSHDNFDKMANTGGSIFAGRLRSGSEKYGAVDADGNPVEVSEFDALIQSLKFIRLSIILCNVCEA